MSKNLLKGFLYFIKFSWKMERSFVFLTILCELLLQVKPIISIILPKFILDAITEKKEWSYVVFYISLYVGLNFIVEHLSNLITYFSEQSTNKLEQATELYLCEEISKSDYATIESKQFLDKRAMAEKYMYVNGMFGGVYFLFIKIIGYVVNFMFIVGIICTLNIWITLLLIFLMGINSFAKTILMKKHYILEEHLEKIRRKLQYVKSIMLDRVWGKEMRINNLQNYIYDKVDKYYDETLLYLKKERYYMLGLRFVKWCTDFIQEGIVYIYLAVQVFQRVITIGSFTMYFNAIGKFSDSMLQVFYNLSDLKKVDLYYKEFEEYLNLPRMTSLGKGIKLKNPEGKHSIEFKDVSFQYPNSNNYVLKDINLKIKSGEKLSIVGENGAGKTTFVKLLIRLYEPTSGNIYVDNVNIKNLDYKSYMDTLSVVFQDFKLFSFSLKENIVLNQGGMEKQKDIYQILEKSGLANNIAKLEKGIDTILFKDFDEAGIELSGGEGQKLSIAKALYKNGGIVILDEPTAALDPRSEYDIYMRFHELVQGKTTIYISHRLSSTRFCDSIAVFEKGTIVEYGTHQGLLDKKGVYADLYTKQAQFYHDTKLDHNQKSN